ncbi:MAG: sensor histidine kinase [Balneolaceae bacterium]|nr:sensor histidine kinase [Balneolaceae bacterium]
MKLNINQAIPVALIINELFINALNHAFPDGKEGTIGIEMYEENEWVFIKV